MSLTSTRNGWRPSGSRRWRGPASAALTAVRTAGIGASRKTVPAAVKPAWLRLGHPHELRANRCRLPGLLFTPRGQPRHASSRRRCSPIRPGPQETGSLFRRSVPRPRRRTETTGKKTGATLSRSQQLPPNPFIVLVLSLIAGETITRKTRSLRCCGKGIAGLPVSFRFQSTGVAPCEHASGR